MISVLAIAVLAMATGMPAGSVSLTQIMPSEIDHGLASVGLNRTYSSIWWPPTQKALRIGDRTFTRGLGMRTPNAIAYRLDGRYERFQAWVGMDAEVADKPGASTVFRIFGDGKILFDSGLMRASDKARRVDISAEGVQKLRLQADAPGAGSAWDHADWAEPTLVGIQPRARIAGERAAYRMRGEALDVLLDSKGHPCGLRLPGRGLKYPIDGGSEIEGCSVTATRVAKTPRGMQFLRTLSCGARMTETFEPAATGILWQLDIESNGKPWGGRVNTVLRWLDKQSAQVWTAWGGGQEWSDPLRPWNFRTDWYEYGTFFNRNYGVSLPIFTILDQKHDAAVTLLENFEDKIIKMNMASDEDGTLTFSRYNLRMGEGKRWRFRLELIPHAADVRAALGAVVARYPLFFDPPNPTAQLLGGHAAYSSIEADLAPKFRQMDFTFNWKASFDFPYMGMFLPPVPARERWLSFEGDTNGITAGASGRRSKSLEELADYSARMRRQGYHVLNYFNVTEFGAGIQNPAPPRKAADDRDLWKDPNDFLYYAVPGAVLRNPNPIYTWGRAVVVDCADPAFKKFLLEQARRHVDELPDSAGICIDRMDWLNQDNPHADDGLTWSDGPARSLLNSWQDLMIEMEPIFHKANKVIFGNPMIRRPDLARYLDGFYDEHGDFGFSINTTSYLALRKPAAMWTRDEEQLKPDPDAIMQRSLYMGVFLTAPVPGNDHCLAPSAWVDRQYLDYGPLFAALRGRKWVLLPHVIEVESPSLANVFEVPKGYVVFVGFAGSRELVHVSLKNLHLRGFRAEEIVPGDAAWKPVAVRASHSTFELDVPLKRGAAVVRLARP
jgi:hypothetical protein